MHRRKLTLVLAILVLAIGAGCNKVPNVVGMKQEDAQKKLEKKKMSVTIQTVHQEGKTAGTVIDQNPAAKSKIPDDKKITLIVQDAGGTTTGGGTGTSGGTGNTGGTTTGGGTSNSGVQVPDLTAMTQTEAEAKLAGLGLALADDVSVEIKPDKAPGKIYDQDPKSGLSVAPLTAIHVWVASDAIVAVPQVVGHTQAEAEQMIKDAHLVPVPAPEIKEGASVPPGSVFEANPNVGTPIPKETPVTLKVRQEAATVPGVVTLDLNTAKVRLYDRGLTPVVKYSTDKTQPNKVLSQSEPEGKTLAKGSQVGLVVGCASVFTCNPHIFEVMVQGGIHQKVSSKTLQDLQRAGGN